MVAEAPEAGDTVLVAVGRRPVTDNLNLDAAGQMQVHDGPYAETREQIGGFYIIDVPDMATAQKWAAQCPGAIWGHIEVRPFSAYPGA